MRKIIPLLLVLSLSILLLGCDKNWGDDDLSRYKGIASAEIPGVCIEFKDDVCGLFGCMVDRCWCDDLSPESPVLYEGSTSLQTTDEVIAYVQNYLDEKSVQQTVKRAVGLNAIFFNVFAEDEEGNEIVYTIAVDGTIIKTMCGV